MHWILKLRQKYPNNITFNSTGQHSDEVLQNISHVTYSYLRSFVSTVDGRQGTSITRHQHTVSSLLRMQRRRSEPVSQVLIKSEMTVAQLAGQLSITSKEILKVLGNMGEDLHHNSRSVLAADVVELVCMEYNIMAKDAHRVERRPPVVTIMGHVDHGKTTLLDTLCRSSIAAAEAGGITQHIGAFLVQLPSGDKITFIDTPGHAAFNAMRARGANVTDIVVLVVAADDGVKRQTVESIRHAVHAKVPLIVAINKIDKPKKNLDLLKQQLMTHGIQLEEFGGEVQAVEISALKGTNLDSLSEAILTLAELSDLKAEADGFVEGVIIESKISKGKGCVATVLIQSGTLKKGNIIIAGDAFAKVRQMYDDRGKVITQATPSTPVEVIGWRDRPSAGEQLIQVESEQKASEVIAARKAYLKEQWNTSMLTNGDVMIATAFREGEGRQSRVSSKDYNASDKLDIVIKGDVEGSVEAIVDALKTYKSDKVKLTVLRSGVGPVCESDIKMAQSFQGLVIGFNVKVPKAIQLLANQAQVPIKTHRVIYKLLWDVKAELSSRLEPIKEDVVVGEGEVQRVFKLTGTRKAVVAGCRVKQGSLRKSNKYKILRGQNCIYEGKLTSLKRGLDDVDTVKTEQECGLTFNKFHGFKEGDRIECYETNYIQQDIHWNWGF